jgi:hypothetical protein
VSACDWEIVRGFRSPGEFERFLDWLGGQIKRGGVIEVPVLHRYAGSDTLRERWFRCANDEHVWRLVEPDFPFRGTFEPVAE